MAHLAQIDWVLELKTFGLAAFLLGIFMLGGWKGLTVLYQRFFAKDGLAEQWLHETKDFHGKLATRLELIGTQQKEQHEMCNRHADLMETVGDSMAEGVKVQTAAVRQLERLVEIHEAPTGSVLQATQQISEMKHDIERGRKALRHACEMCRRVSEKEFPNSAAEVAKHCAEIERVIGEA
jgi:hypothetical protein